MRYFQHILKLMLFLLMTAGVVACSINQMPVAGWFQQTDTAEYDLLIEKGRNLVNNRHHQKAVLLFDQAGVIAPQRPEWLYEKARALFYMDRLPESIASCEKALDRDPLFYEALSFGWAVRLVAEKSSDRIKETVRNEINGLLDTGNRETEALLAVYEGYQWLSDREQEQKLIIALAQKAANEDRDTREIIASRLFEQIVQTRDNVVDRIELMEEYSFNFTDQRYTAYVVFQLLKAKQELLGEEFGGKVFSGILLQKAPESYQVKTGVAYWMIENNQDAEYSELLLMQSLMLLEKKPQEKPPFFEDDLWQNEQEKQKDRIRLLLGRARYNAGRFDEAKKDLATVVASLRPWGDAHYYLGKIALAEGETDDAISHLRRSLEIGVRSDDAEAILSRLLAKEYGVEEAPGKYFANMTDGILFTDVTEAAGLGSVNAKRVAWGDVDQDGFDDLLLDGNRLFRNAGDGSFIDITPSSGSIGLKTASGGIWGDYNNDGRLDIFVTDHSGNHLLENTGNGFFVDRTEILPGPVTPMQTEAAAWGDLDNDGFVDLYLANYETWGVMRGIGNHDRLYKNIGGIRFEDITDKAGIKTDEAMCGRGVTWTDINDDGFSDIVVANYRLDPNFLWMNRQSLLTESAETFGVRGHETEGAFGHSIGPVSGDLDNDGDLDLFITNLAHPRYIEFSDVNMMLMNQGAPDYHFADQFKDSGIFFEETNSDPALGDVDNDGDLDLYMTSIYPGRYSRLYINDGKGFFTDVSWTSGTRVENSWGAAFSDYNHDGFADLLVASADGIRLFKNNGTPHHWIAVKIYDDRCNRFGIGSRVLLKYGDKFQTREVTAGRGTGSQDSLTLVFGLGDYVGPVEIEAKTLCGDRLKTVIDGPDQMVVLTH